MPDRVGPGRWEALCARCSKSSGAVEGADLEEAREELARAGWVREVQLGSRDLWRCAACASSPPSIPRLRTRGLRR